jgi:hypothetical protein
MPWPEAASSFSFDGQPVPFVEGQTIAGALLAAGHRTLRRTRRGQRPRGLFCGVGVCADCLVAVDGVDGVRACLRPAYDAAVVVPMGGTVAGEYGAPAAEAGP